MRLLGRVLVVAMVVGLSSASLATPAGANDAAYVEESFRIFLGRQPSGGERTEWASRLADGQPRVRLSRALAASPEWAGLEVANLYRSALGREPEPAGAAFWLQAMRVGKASLRDVATQIYGSAESYQRAGGTNERFVTHLYRLMLGRDPDPAGLAHWAARMRGGLPPSGVVAGFYDAVEFRRQQVAQTYLDVLGRPAEPHGLAFWADRLLTVDRVALAADLAASQEAYQRAAAAAAARRGVAPDRGSGAVGVGGSSGLAQEPRTPAAAPAPPPGVDTAACTRVVAQDGTGHFTHVAPAVAGAQAGDTVCIKSGTYPLNVVDLSVQGTSTRPIVIRNHPGHAPTLVQAGADLWVLKFRHASHVVVDGLRFVGRDATEGPGDDDVAAGLVIDDSHHMTVRNSTFANFGGGGLHTNRTNNLVIESNTVTGNGRSSCVQTSGISVHSPQAAPGSDYAPAFEIVIRGNTGADNANQRTPSDPWHQGRTALGWYPGVCRDYAGAMASWGGQNVTTDGNCIILDVAHNWPGVALIENNLCHHNAGRGVAMTASSNAVIRNNTLYHNVRPVAVHSPDGRNGLAGAGDVSVNGGSNITVENNLIFHRPGQSPITTFNGGTVNSRSNIAASSNTGVRLVQPGADFRLAEGSTAIDTATSNSPAEDLQRRPRDARPDVGAFER